MADPLSRRTLLHSLALSPIALAGFGAFATPQRVLAQEAGLIAANVCMVQRQTTAGPFDLDPGLDRSDIREDRSGAPLSLALQVVQADCTPVTGARVEVWHCDAMGVYSGYDGQGAEGTRGETFLRGAQHTDARGVVGFRTIYPGWYPGRTTHIHYRVNLDGDAVLTGQVFFPDALSAYLYRSARPYRDRNETRSTTNDRDGILRRAGEGAFAQVTESAAGHEAALVLGIKG